MALIKKNSEVPSNALIFVAEFINSALQELYAKTSSICKIAFFLYIMAPTFASSKLIFHERENKNNKKRPLSGSFRNSVTVDSFLLHFINIHLLSLLRKILNVEKTLLKHVKHFYLFGDLIGFAPFIEFKNSRITTTIFLRL